MRIQKIFSVRPTSQITAGELVILTLREGVTFGLIVARHDDELCMVVLDSTLDQSKGLHIRPISALGEKNYVTYGKDWTLKLRANSLDLGRYYESPLSIGNISVTDKGVFLCVTQHSEFGLPETRFINLEAAKILPKNATLDDCVSSPFWQIWLDSELEKGDEGQPFLVHQNA